MKITTTKLNITKITTTLHKISNRGIMTISILLSLLSLPLVRYLYQLEYSSRMQYNQNYQGQYGGEILIPFIIIFIAIIILSERDRRKYIKYEKH